LIEREAPNRCCTETWKKRNHWVGSQATTEIATSVSDAEKYLQINRPVRRYGSYLAFDLTKIKSELIRL
jgi:transcriptional regulator ATRX